MGTSALRWIGSAQGAPLSNKLRVYYSDDTTDIMSNASPFHQRGDDITETQIGASIDEAADAGIDVYLSQPGTGWIPWWHSDIYPPAAHYKWYEATYGVHLSGFEKFMMMGGDVVGAALDHCRKRNLPIMVSIRLNDIHGIALSGKSPDEARAHLNDPAIADWQRRLPITMSRVHMDHPEWRIVPGSDKTQDMLWNWAVPEAVAHKLALCMEVVRRYDVDGIELDFMRYPRFFADAVPLAQRASIISDFLTSIRAALDAGRKHRELALRVPAKFAGLAPLGIDPSKLTEIGIDRLTLSSNTFTSQDIDFDLYRRRLPGIKLSLELADAKHFLMHQKPREPDDTMLMLAAPADDITTAYLAQQKGLDSVSLFNFVYYRKLVRQVAGYDHTHEPPFSVIKDLKRPDTIFQPVQSWFLSTVYFNGIPGAQMPGHLESGKSLLLKLDIYPPTGGWAETGTLRVVARQPPDHASDAEFEVSLNGSKLSPTKIDVSGFDENPGLPFRAWSVPRPLLKIGTNIAEIAIIGSAPRTEIALLEILMPSAR